MWFYDASIKFSLFSLITVNLIAIPCILGIIFVYIFVGKIGSYQTEFIMSYIFHLAILHICLACIQLNHNDLSEKKVAATILSYLSYYAFLACLSWLYVCCFDIFYIMKTYRQKFIVKHGTNRANFKANIVVYYLVAFAVPIILTLIIAGIMHIFNVDSKKNHDSTKILFELKNGEKNQEFEFVLVPLFLMLGLGIIIFVMTKIQMVKAFLEAFYEKRCPDKAEIEKERKRLEICQT